MEIKITFTDWSLEFRSRTREEQKQWLKYRSPVGYLAMEIEDLRKELEQLKQKNQ